ncbi:helix-turn-helix transcriptional regulator [bacterium]|nr:MAG: helix-turn-helix transcriptional regulator [bacterium]
MNMFTQTTGEKIKLARLRLGITQQQLADLLNDKLTGDAIIERSLISRWEQDKNFPRNSRKMALQDVLNIQLGSPPSRRDTFSSYMTNLNEIETSILLGLQNCHELWMTNKAIDRSIWHEMDRVQRIMRKLKNDKTCYFREIFYIRNLEDLKNVKKIISIHPPNYEIRIRVAPGHAFPVLFAPKNRYGVILSGFFDDITSVGLELSGQVSGFNEHYLRLIWNKATPIYENSKFLKDNYELAFEILQSLGGSVKNEFTDRF